MILYNACSSYFSMIARYALYEAGVPFENKRMDIHLAKEQLTPWYMAINPGMTVPSLTNEEQTLIDSRDILKFAASKAEDKWLDADVTLAPQIEQIVAAHYAIIIERLTFLKALTSIPLMKFIIFRMLRKIIKQLESDLPNSANPTATKAKIKVDRARLAYFSEGNLADKLQTHRDTIKDFISKLPTPDLFLFGEKPSSADIVTVVLFGRLKMIGEYQLVPSPSALSNWFERMQARPAYKEADIWTHFQPWRILLKR